MNYNYCFITIFTRWQ